MVSLSNHALPEFTASFDRLRMLSSSHYMKVLATQYAPS